MVFDANIHAVSSSLPLTFLADCSLPISLALLNGLRELHDRNLDLSDAILDAANSAPDLAVKSALKFVYPGPKG